MLKEKKIKATMKHYFTPIRKFQITKVGMPSLVKGKDVIATGTLIHCWWICKMAHTHTHKNWESSLTASYTVKHTFIISSNPKLRYFLNGNENIYLQEVCLHMFIAV